MVFLMFVTFAISTGMRNEYIATAIEHDLTLVSKNERQIASLYFCKIEKVTVAPRKVLR